MAAARANVGPGLVLSLFAVGLLLAYYRLEPVHVALQQVGRWKDAGGWLFPAISTAVFGALVPGLVQRLRPGLRHTMPGKALLYLMLVWAVKGVEVDLLYRLQSHVFGDGRDPATLTRKVLVDMGVYCPLWAVPSTVLIYQFKDADFFWRKTIEPIRRHGLGRWYLRHALPVLVSTWAVWVPAVTVIYCLPLPLQLPMQNLVLCFWTLLLLLLVRPPEADAEPAQRPVPNP